MYLYTVLVRTNYILTQHK